MPMTAEVIDLDARRVQHVIAEAGLTDIGNAERMIALHGDAMRYVPKSKKWYTWDQRRWIVDDTLAVQRYAKNTVRAMLRESADLDGTERKNLSRHANASEANGRIKAMLERAAAEPGVAIMPDSFDAHPMRLNAANGVLDLETGQLMPHRREFLMTKLVPFDYPEREAAECPLWLTFLDRVFGGDAELIEYLQRAIGYTLTGVTREQCLHLLYGTGANGKSTFLEIVAELLGDYAVQADFATFLDKKNSDGPRNDIARLNGARLVRSSEVGEGKRFNEALVKSLTGGEKISARFLYAEDFEFTPTFKLWFSFNHKPVIRGTDHAIWRRVRLIPFAVTIADDEKDDQLLSKLRAELPGILRWAVDGCVSWQKIGLKPPESIVAATDSYRTESDTLGAFIDECCVLGPGFEEGATPLYKAFKRWAHDGSEYEMSQTAFGRKMTERGFDVDANDTARKLKFRRGLRLKAEYQPKNEQQSF